MILLLILRKFVFIRFFVLLLIVLFILQSCCMTKQPEQEAGVLVVFEGINDSDQSKAWVIETEQGKPEATIDSVYYGALHHITEYSFFLPFRTIGENGDYYIYADSVRGENVIKEIELWKESDKCGNEEIFYHYKFNGFLQTQSNKRIVVYQTRP